MPVAKKILLFFCFCFAFTQVSAQRELLAEDRTEKNDTTPSFGINEANFFHFRTGMGMIFGPEGDGVGFGFGRSLEPFIGFRYKRKLSGMFSIGLDPTYKYSAFNFNDKDKNAFLDTNFWGSGTDTFHNREKIGLHSVGLGAFIRINFDPKRGDYMGTYLDLGAGGDFIFANEYITKGELQNGTMVKTRYTRNPFISRFQYNYFARLGRNWLALTFAYRPSPIFKNSYNYPMLPKYVAGVEFNLYGR